MEKKKALKLFDYYGTFLDGMMSFFMVFSLFAMPPFIIPYSNATKSFRFAMGWAATFMIAWTVLLFWASLKPVERKEIIPLTLFIVVLGLSLTAILVAPIELANIWVFQIFAIIIPGTIIYLWAKDAEV